ncbi:hypothetical protein b3_0249 [Synechococcus phage B3]|jgi:hypothetical protein|nr:hypothetical protein b3_0249 [Synechococcus phage B3]QGT54857.1 hypothetical protein b23_0243 [Synechococcus phage B23]
MAYKDYRPETRSLFKRLKEHDFSLSAVNNGEEWVKLSDVGDREFLEETVAADDAVVTVRYTDGKRYKLYLVFGNCPGELVCDCSSFDPLSVVVDQHADKWENRKQPTR